MIKYGVGYFDSYSKGGIAWCTGASMLSKGHKNIIIKSEDYKYGIFATDDINLAYVYKNIMGDKYDVMEMNL